MDISNTDYGITQSPQQTISYKNIIELIESSDTIKDLDMRMSGLIRVIKEGRNLYQRFNPPHFTDEYIKELMFIIRMGSNTVTAQTEWTNNEIKSHMRSLSFAIVESLCTKGDDNYISEESWDKIIRIHESGGNKSGWLKIIGKEWTLNSQVTRQMLTHVKDPHEEYDQFIDMKQLFWAVFTFIDASYRRSKDALTLKHHQEVIKETHVQREKENKKGLFSFGRAANNIGGVPNS